MSRVLQELSSIEEFLKELPDFDQEMESQRKDAEASGEVGWVGFVLLFFCQTGCNRISRVL